MKKLGFFLISMILFMNHVSAERFTHQPFIPNDFTPWAGASKIGDVKASEGNTVYTFPVTLDSTDLLRPFEVSLALNTPLLINPSNLYNGTLFITASFYTNSDQDTSMSFNLSSYFSPYLYLSKGDNSTLQGTSCTIVGSNGGTTATYSCLVPYGYTHLNYLAFSIQPNNYMVAGGYRISFNPFLLVYDGDVSQGTISSVIQQQTEELKKGQEETNKQLGDLNDNLTNSDTNEASSSANEFFSGFESDDFGLSSIITAPLNLIKSITSSTCTPIGFKAPFVDQQITLPCMGNIYKKYFGSFLTLYQTITFGIVAYWVSVNIFFMVKGFKDPDSDRIEVLDL